MHEPLLQRPPPPSLPITDFRILNRQKTTHAQSPPPPPTAAASMSLPSGQTVFLLPPSTLHRRAIPTRHRNHEWKRRRLKHLTARCELNPTPPPLDNLFHGLLSQFPPINSISLIAPAVGFASGIAVFFSSRTPKLFPNPNPIGNSGSDIGEWILFASPTPFNRFVTLRCPSIDFPENEFLEDVSEKLIKEERHYVKLNSGRIIHPVKSSDEGDDEDMVYQRLCVGTEDGGVLSLDWPANLDLEEERGFDTTVLIVPGTVDGSSERKIRACVCDCLRRGVFPIVMNPRGCAGSPLTTPRLFTAADSDDISIAVQYITKKRPWTTLMAIGWEYGANMLTKYLAESGERTPLTAAICVDNPFDLEEATRSSVYHPESDQRQTDGLIKILQFNKELFQGRRKGFNVERALSASSVRDFESAISMVSYGFDTVEDFYAKSSTRDVINKVKVPVLFIQNDDKKVPFFSIPRDMIAENPYTSLLLCTYKPSSRIVDDRFSWCQHLALEWLMAVELGLLKGRHPLLKDVDITVNLSKGLALLEGRASSKGGTVGRLLNLTNGSSTNPQLEMFQENVRSMETQLESTKDTGELHIKGLQVEDNDVGKQFNAAVDPTTEEGDNSSESERGQVIQTAQVVMNMLDVTMPEALSDEQKKKVLNAVGQGETVMKALQDAVPDDVRGKLTTAVSGILQSPGSDLKFDKLLKLRHSGKEAPGYNSKSLDKDGPKNPNRDEDVQSLDQKKSTNGSEDVQSLDQKKSTSGSEDVQSLDQKKSTSGSEDVQSLDQKKSTSGSEDVQSLDQKKSTSGSEDVQSLDQKKSTSGSEDVQSLDQKKSTNGSGDGHSRVDHSPDMSARDMELEKQSSEFPQKQNEPSQDLEGGRSHNEMENLNESTQPDGGNTVEKSDRVAVEEVNAKQDSSTEVDVPDGTNTPNQKKVERGTSEGKSEPKSENNMQKNDFPSDQDKIPEPSNREESSSAPSPTSEALVTENEAENNQGKEEKGPMSVVSQNATDSPSFSVSQAFDALTGFDDSTQVAVNSVFNVIEGMLDQLEENKDKIDEVKNEHSINEVNGVKEEEKFSESSVSKDRLPQDDPRSSGTIDRRPNESTQSGNSDGTSLHDTNGSAGKYGQHYANVEHNQNSTDINNTRSQVETEHGTSFPAARELPTINSMEYLNSNSEKIPSCSTALLLGDPIYRECLKTYLSSKTKNAEPLDMNKRKTLYLDYSPEEGQWKLSDQNENDVFLNDEFAASGGYTDNQNDSHPRSKNSDNTIEPSYVILDSGKPEHQNEEHKKYTLRKNAGFDETKSDGSIPLIKSLILECLEVEVGRRANAEEHLELKLAREMEYVANAVSVEAGAAVQGKHHMDEWNDNLPGELGILDGEKIVRAISSSVQDTEYLRTILPIGVIVGSTLAALIKFFVVGTVDGDDEQNLVLDTSTKSLLLVGEKKNNHRPSSEREINDNFASSIDEEDDIDLGNSKVMVGAVTAALGASALLAHHHSTEVSEPSNDPLDEKDKSEEYFKPDEMPEKTHNNLVTSLAEKAMSVASPVVPLKEDGQVDHERIVSMLAEMGQKGGLLKLIGKFALLWGGIRGAMSLTDKLILFLHIAERPLPQRILGFVFMVLLLWSPVVLPLLPTLLQSWATNNPFRIAEFACIAGLYVCVMIMITLWGKRIRQYDDPLKQYGFDLASVPKMQNFLKGLVGGAVLVTVIHAVNASLGCGYLHWPTTLSSLPAEPVALMKAYGNLLLLIIKGIATATFVAAVEELLFRAWLPQEIAADFGYHRGVFISGLVFALCQRSIMEIPGLCILSISLSGARQRSGGSLALPMGLRAGILASTFILKTGNFLAYHPTFPLWVIGVRPFKPFSGLVGLAFSLLLVVIFYPKQPLCEERETSVIRD